MITGAQIRQARKLLGWSVKELGRRAKLAASTVHRAECVDGEPPITEAHAAVLRHVLERRGVEFTNGDEPNVKLKGEAQVNDELSLPPDTLVVGEFTVHLRQGGARIADSLTRTPPAAARFATREVSWRLRGLHQVLARLFAAA